MKTITCVVCGKKQGKFFSYQNYEYYKCRNCKLVSTYPIPNKITIENYYKKRFKEGNYKLLREYARDYRNVYEGFAKIILNELSKTKTDPKDVKVLDVGCFTGEFLYILHKNKFNVFGVELQKEAVKLANAKIRNKITVGDIENYKFNKEGFDIITLQGLLEHVEDPKKLIKNCSNHLKKDGLIMIQTPNSSSFFSKVLKKYWPPYSPIEHVHLFSYVSLKKLLQEQGFEIIFKKNHWKMLPINYVYQMFAVFGNEFKVIFHPIYAILPKSIKSKRLPFYIGEMIVVAKKIE